MKKKIAGKQLSRGQGARKALYRSLVRALVLNGKITTTKAKAQFLTERLEKLVNKAKTNTLAVRRDVTSFLGNDREVVELLFSKVAKAFESRHGGFTRMTNLPKRFGDNAKMARIEWVEEIILSSEVKKVDSKSGLKAKAIKTTKKGVLKTIKAKVVKKEKESKKEKIKK